MTANMYRVGDYVYFETSATAPYQIRRIEELTKTPTGNVEAKVMCFYRRRDVSNTLVNLADKHQTDVLDDEEEAPGDAKVEDASGLGLSEPQRHQLKHRELFLSRQVETLPATTIRGKCSVTLLNETESLLSYLGREDVFYYTLVYDQSQKTLLADKGEIRVGGRYQAEIQPLLADGEGDGRDLSQMEELVWRPDTGLAPADLDKFLLVARAVGTLARAMDTCGAVRQPSLGQSAASASRDITQAHAHGLLHAAGYDIGTAFCRLVTDDGPLLCRDELEEWSASEGNLFEEAMDKYGKDFHDIRQDFLPWKSFKAIVEYFYMWKTTDRYVQQKRLKASEAERKLKQVYIPNYTKPNAAVLYNRPDAGASRGCESCYSTNSSGQWYSWGPPHLSCRLCSNCWTYWKKYGGLKSPTRLEKVVGGSNGAGGGGAGTAPAGRTHRCTVAGCDKEFRLRPHLVRHLAAAHNLDEASLGHLSKAKAVKSMLMVANCTTRLARALCPRLLRLRRLARRPCDPKFDARPALKELTTRLRDCQQPEQLLTRRPPPAPMGPERLTQLLCSFCPQLPASADCELLRRDSQSSIVANQRKTFVHDAEKLAEFHRQLDEHRPVSPTPPPPPAASALNGGAGQGTKTAAALSLMPRKRHLTDHQHQQHQQHQHQQHQQHQHQQHQQQQQQQQAVNGDDTPPPAKKGVGAAASASAPAAVVAAGGGAVNGAKPGQQQQQQQQQHQHQQQRAGIPTKLSQQGLAGGDAAKAAAAAEEMLLFGTKPLRAEFTSAQLRRAARRPFKVTLSSSSSSSSSSGGGGGGGQQGKALNPTAGAAAAQANGAVQQQQQQQQQQPATKLN